MLGAARIAPKALLQPAAQRDDVRVVAVAARDVARAEQFAAEHAIERVVATYEELVHDPGIDVVYNPLPNGLHASWTLRALEAGKHVLCEKPLANNASEGEAMVAAAQRVGRLLMEAFHYAYHPLTDRWRSLLQQCVLGEIVEVRASFRTSIPATDIRYVLELGGGATMDLGCYCIHAVRLAVGSEPKVVRARAEQGPPGIDRELSAELEFPGGVRGEVVSAMTLAEGFRGSLRVVGRDGVLEVENPTLPHLGHRLRVESRTMKVDEEVVGRTSYDYQLEAFVAALRTGEAPLTSGEDSVANLRVIDAAYAAAGLPLRGDGG